MAVPDFGVESQGVLVQFSTMHHTGTQGFQRNVDILVAEHLLARKLSDVWANFTGPKKLSQKTVGCFSKNNFEERGWFVFGFKKLSKKTSAFSFKTKEISLQKRLLLIKTVSYNQSTPVLQGPSGVHFLKSEVPL